MDLITPRLRLRPWRPEDRAPFAPSTPNRPCSAILNPMTREGSDAMLDRIDAHFAQYGWGFWRSRNAPAAR